MIALLRIFWLILQMILDLTGLLLKEEIEYRTL